MNSSEYDCDDILEAVFSSWPPPMSPAGVHIYCTFMLCFTIVTLFGNSLVIYVVYHVRALQKRQNIYIVSLAFADMCLALIVMTGQMYEAWNRAWDLPKWLCHTRSIFDGSLSQISIYNLTAVAVDRYIAICHPYMYVRVSRVLTATIVASCWVIPLLFWAVYFFEGWNTSGGLEGVQFCLIQIGVCPFIQTSSSLYATSSFVVVIPAFIMSILYVNIYTTAKRHFRAVQAVTVTEESRKQNKDFMKSTKAARTLAIVIGVFFICWIPVIFVSGIDYLTDFTLVSPVLLQALVWLAYLNSMMNPVLYYFFSQEFKVAFKAVFNRKLPIEDIHFVTTSSTVN